MKTLTSHEANPDELSLIVQGEGQPGADGVYYKYAIHTNDGELLGHVSFQKGPTAYGHPNGVTVASLLAICEDHLNGMQNNAQTRGADYARALDCIGDALTVLV